MTRDVMPFVRPSEAAAEFGPWLLEDEVEWRPLPRYLPDWDYQTNLALRRRLRVNLERLREESWLESDVPIAVVVEWRSSTAQFVGCAYRAVIRDSASSTIDFVLAGTELSGRLTLTTRVVVARSLETGRAFVAKHGGDVLLEDSVDVDLQGAASRLPVYVVDFAEQGLDEDASWHVEISSDPSQPAVGGVRVYLNKDHSEIVDAAVRAAKPTPVQKRLLDWLWTDVARTLVEAGLRVDWLTQLPSCIDEPESLGASVAALISNLFGEEQPETIAQLRDTDPGRFGSRLQGALKRIGQEFEL
ncbi:hypothetical protein ACWDNI_32085 [Nocardia niigatensis]